MDQKSNEAPATDRSEPVRIWEQTITIPTYPVGEPNLNPMFLAKRVYQGSSGTVYPLPVIDQVSDERVDRPYHAVFLENRYLKIMVLPEIGGRIQMALDKTNGYHFVYYNRVIKPALVGLAGPWISGGIEFNWPQHHRPSTFAPVSHALEAHPDGSRTVWVGEVERMTRTRGMAGITLRPDCARIEVEARLYNATPTAQTFLWWANPAAPVNDDYQSIFPPDVHTVMDHGKRGRSRFPIATGEYYKTDYSSGVDISWWKNIPVPTSYMVSGSDHDFMGGYDHGRGAGLLHIADRHVSPGKKQWTWGTAKFGRAWERNLTDDDGPYVELMTGVYTDNQPDFGWIAPYEERRFTQFFMPYKGVGCVKNATADAAVNMEVDGRSVEMRVYVTSPQAGAHVVLTHTAGVVYDQSVDMSPDAAWKHTCELPDTVHDPQRLCVVVRDADDRELVRYQRMPESIEPVPEPATAAPPPEQIRTNEELYLTGLHLEQYRHATREPAGYYREALRRDRHDARANQALGTLLYRRGQFEEAGQYLQTAIERLTHRNPNPRDGECFYLLGLTLRMLGRDDEAYAAFYKSCWNAAQQLAGYFALAQIASQRGELESAIGFCDRALRRGSTHHKARCLKAAWLRRLGRFEEARHELYTVLRTDPLDFAALDQSALLEQAAGDPTRSAEAAAERDRVMLGDPQNEIELAIDYLHAGLHDEMIEGLERAIARYPDPQVAYPMLGYYLGYACERAARPDDAALAYRQAAEMTPDLCFPHRLESIGVLRAAINANPRDARAHYYLGNLLYGLGQHEPAVTAWEASRRLDPAFPTVHRNLGLAYFNQRHDPDAAAHAYEHALECRPDDARVLFEYDQLQRKRGRPPEQRLARLEQAPEVVNTRDDLYLEHATLLNTLGNHERALDRLLSRNFHPWEGGEGKVPGQYVFGLAALGRARLDAGDHQAAVAFLKRALDWPHSLGEGRLPNTTLNEVHFLLGDAYHLGGDAERARDHWEQASQGDAEPASMAYYNDAPPETIFYQSLALRRLGREPEARSRFHRLIEHAETHWHDEVEIDYFAVSLPDFLIFENDLQSGHRLHCRQVLGLGRLGLGDHARAADEFEAVLAVDPAHQQAAHHLRQARQTSAYAPSVAVVQENSPI
jgi:tetratricopeptide (TPR) repeat protein